MTKKTFNLILLATLIIISCNNRQKHEEIEKKIEKKISTEVSDKTNKFIYNGSFNDWFNNSIDLYFPIQLFDSTNNKYFKYDYFLKIRNEWLYLIEIKYITINEFPIIPLSIWASKNKEPLIVSPSPEMLNKRINISYSQDTNRKQFYEVKISIVDRGQHGVISSNKNSHSIKDKTDSCVITFNISLDLGILNMRTNKCKKDYIW